MKVLLLTTFPLNEKELLLDNCKKQYHIFTYMIKKYLNKRKNIETLLYQCTTKGKSSRFNIIVKSENFPEADHAILIDNRGFHNRVQLFMDLLRPKIKGAICTISASNAIVGKEDILYYLIPSGKSNKKHCKYIGWACDHELCVPSQNKTKIRFLIDHNYYGPHERMNKMDMTDTITEQLCEFLKTYDNDFIVRRFIRGGIETVDIKNINTLEKYKQGSGLCYTDACKEYSNTDIFIVTHLECMGLSVLECAMAGALIVTPKGFIKDELINYLHAVQISTNKEDKIDFKHIIESIDHEKSRQKALKFNWEKSCNIIVNTLNDFNKYKKRDYRFKNKHNLFNK